MSRLPPALARRIDRLARRAHRFHRFAHHPLCTAYAGELVPLGGRGRLCRGCTLAAAGVLLGSALALYVPWAWALGSAQWAALAGGIAAWAAALVLHALAAGRGSPPGAPRQSKLLTRFVPAFALAFGAVLGARARWPGGMLLAAGCTLGAACALALYRRRGPDRAPCMRCPERSAAVCSGFLPIVRRERAFRRLARRLIASAPPM